jgi:hypothetical protein
VPNFVAQGLETPVDLRWFWFGRCHPLRLWLLKPIKVFLFAKLAIWKTSVCRRYECISTMGVGTGLERKCRKRRHQRHNQDWKGQSGWPHFPRDGSDQVNRLGPAMKPKKGHALLA